MKMLKDLLAIAWPPYRRKMERHKAWCMVLGAGIHLHRHDDWNLGDYEAGKIISQTLRMLNK
jgi:hypothetical protein